LPRCLGNNYAALGETPALPGRNRSLNI
jgi:hypothetical protein